MYFFIDLVNCLDIIQLKSKNVRFNNLFKQTFWLNRMFKNDIQMLWTNVFCNNKNKFSSTVIVIFNALKHYAYLKNCIKT